MAKNDSFKKKELNKKDYAGKEKGAKTVKGVGVGAAVLAFGPKIIKGAIKLGKKLIFKA